MAPDYLKFCYEMAEPPPHGAPYGVPLPGTEQPDRTPIYRHWRMKDRPLLDTVDPEILTGHDMFEVVARRQPRKRCLGSRSWNSVKKEWGPYEWIDYGTVAKRRGHVGAGLVEIHRKAGIAGEKYPIGIWCQNRPEWELVDLGCMSQSLYTVSLYDTLGPTAIEYIANHASLACIATSLPHIPTLLQLKPRLPHLKIIVCIDPLEAGEQAGYSKLDVLSALAAQQGLAFYSLAQVEAMGAKQEPVQYNPPQPNDLITINYTSGTTGTPKGVLIPHRAAIAALSSSLCTVHVDSNAIGCSYLPLAHIYGRMVEQTMLWAGGAVAYFHGNILELVDDLKLIRPTMFISVPRLYSRFGGVIRANTVEQEGFRGSLSRHIVNAKLSNLKDPEAPSASQKHMLYDRIWGRKVASAIGLDRTHDMISGAAPLDPSLHQFLRVVFGNHFLQGFGMTETYAVGLAQCIGDHSVGNCGAPGFSHEICLLSVPDMDYLVTDKPQPRGEMLIRGGSICDGYFKDDKSTQDAFLPGGWFRTGDICTVDARGRFAIIDRRKNVLKLAQGEYVAPERIENVYTGNLGYLAQAYVHGDSLKTSLVGLFAVQPDAFAALATKVLGRPIDQNDRQALQQACDNPHLRQFVQADLDRIAREGKFAGYERVRALKLMVDPFTIENELMTPTLKLKRPQTVKMYKHFLDELYREVDAADGVKAKL